MVEAVERPGRWSFRQPLVQETCYQLLLSDRRRQLHAMVAADLEADRSGRPVHPLRLAHHWRGADKRASALGYLERAGYAALQAGADREALRALDEAAGLAEGLPDEQVSSLRRAELQRGRGAALQGLGEMDAAERALRRSLDLVGWAPPRRTAGWVWMLVREGIRQGSFRLLPRLAVRTRNENRRQAQIAASKAASWYANGSYFRVEALPWLAMGLLSANLAEQASDRSIAGAAYVNLGVIAGTVKVGWIERIYRRLSDESDEPRTRVIKEWARAVSDMTRCAWADARQRTDEGLRVGREYGDHYALGHGVVIDALLHYFQGSLAECLPPFAEAVEMNREYDNREQMAYGLVFSVPALLSLGHIDEAEEQLASAEQHQEGADYFSRVAFHGARAGLRMRQGRTDEAVEHARTSLEMYSAKPLMIFLYLGTFGLVAEALLTVEEPKLQAKALRNLAEGALLHWYFKPRSLMFQGTAAWQAGRKGKARAKWNKGLAAARQYSMRWDEARILAEQARHGEGDPLEAAAALRAVGAVGDLHLLADVLPPEPPASEPVPEPPPEEPPAEAPAAEAAGEPDAPAVRPDLFALGEHWLAVYRGKLAAHGLELPADLKLVPSRGILCSYNRSNHELCLSVPDWNDPAAALYVMFMGGMFSAESEEALVRFLTLFVPRVVAHELGHALRDHAGLFGEDLWREEQIANELAVALQNHHLSPDDRAFFRSFIQRALVGIRAKMPSESLARNLYGDVLHSTYASGEIGTRTLETYELLGDVMHVPPDELLRRSRPDAEQPVDREADIAAFNAAYMSDQLSYFYFQLEWMNIDLMAQSQRYIDEFAQRWLDRRPTLLPTFDPETEATADGVRALYQAHRECAGVDETAARWFYKRYRSLLLTLSKSSQYERGPWTDVIEQQGSFLLETWRDDGNDRLEALASVVPDSLGALFPRQIAESPPFSGELELHLPQIADKALWGQVCTRAGTKPAADILRRLELLDRADVFRSLPARVLLDIAVRLVRVGLEAGEPIIWRGEHSNDVFILLDGTLRWEVTVDGRTRSGTIHPGHVVGEMAFLTDGERSADVRARTAARAFVLQASDLRRLMHHHPSILLGIARELAHRVEAANAGQGSMTGVDLTGVNPVLDEDEDED